MIDSQEIAKTRILQKSGNRLVEEYFRSRMPEIENLITSLFWKAAEIPDHLSGTMNASIFEVTHSIDENSKKVLNAEVEIIAQMT